MHWKKRGRFLTTLPCFTAKKQEPALIYSVQTRMTLDFIRHFRLGYAPKGLETLRKLLTSDGCAERDLQEQDFGHLFFRQEKRFFLRENHLSILDATGAVHWGFQPAI